MDIGFLKDVNKLNQAKQVLENLKNQKKILIRNIDDLSSLIVIGGQKSTASSTVRDHSGSFMEEKEKEILDDIKTAMGKYIDFINYELSRLGVKL